MKKRSIHPVVLFVPALAILPCANVLAAGNSTIEQQGIDPAIIFFFPLALILAILALWLYKSNKKLKIMSHVEPEGAAWVNQHLNDLETHQLEKLIKHGNEVTAIRKANNTQVNQ